MDLSLGVDTGGTYTDAVIVHRETRKIVASAKFLTTPENLFLGISSAIGQCLEGLSSHFSRRDIRMVCLSTTLATNAITEGYGGRVCEILIGYDRQLLVNQGFMEEMVTDDIIWLAGGHDIQGNEVAALDEISAEKAVSQRAGSVEAFAVSGYFSTRNPDHERRIKQLITGLSNLPVTCAHELTTRLNAVNRAITTAHNARLIPLLKQLISDVHGALSARDITAPLMIVKGDGAIVPAHWAAGRPIETILSGPAASCVGAGHLSPENNVWVADMGGTTTDMALLVNGYPAIHPQGAWITSRRTMVEAVDIHTVGIGGDSRVGVDRQKNICIGPRRSIPLCHMAQKHPKILKILAGQAEKTRFNDHAGQFITARRPHTGSLPPEEMALLSRVTKAPVSLQSLSEDTRQLMTLRRIQQMEKMSLVNRATFTPTDALHVLGKMATWDDRASHLGAQILARHLDMEVTAFCEAVIRAVSRRLTKAFLGKALGFRSGPEHWEKHPAARAILALALDGEPHEELACRIRFKKPLVAIGAPVASYMPDVSAALNTRLIIPDDASVANAFGAATAGIIQRGRAVIRMMAGGRFFRVHRPDGVADFPSMEAAMAHGKTHMAAHVSRAAQSAGATDITVEISCSDHGGTLPAGKAQEQFLDTEIHATARGAFDSTKTDITDREWDVAPWTQGR